MLDDFSKYLDENVDDVFDKQVYLAISGGIDSMTLSHLLKLKGISHVLLHCNFSLRGIESDEDESFLVDYAQANNLEIFIKRFDTKTIASNAKKSIQETARKLRYDWFEEIIEDAPNSILFTAHHLDDSIETFFINTLRGTGLKGLTGIPNVRKYIYRPLLNFTSEDIYAFSIENSIAFREDSSNQDSKYLRNNIRHNIIPDLVAIEPNLKSKMNGLLSELNETYKWIENRAQIFINNHFIEEENKTIVPLDVLKKEDQLFIHYIMKGYNLNRIKLQSFYNFLSSNNGSFFYTKGYQFLNDRNKLIITSSLETRKTNNVVLINDPNSNLNFENTLISLNVVEGNSIEHINLPVKLDLDKLVFPLKFSNWNEGDKITPLGMSGAKLLSDIFINKKIDQLTKNELIVLSDKTGIIAVLGVVISDQVKVDENTTRMLEINLAAI
jgi:tRNA(Ile)-lysidine synthase